MNKGGRGEIARAGLEAVAVTVAAFALLGCAVQSHRAVTYYLPHESCHADVTLANCQQADPHTCRKTIVKYLQGCEQISVEKQRK